MKKAASPTHRWFEGWRARPDVVVEVDPADCGTAYGLDLCFPAEEPAASPTSPPAPRSWRERWTQRRRAS